MKKQVPQIVESTGLGADYLNTLTPIGLFIFKVQMYDNLELAKTDKSNSQCYSDYQEGIQPYTEYFSSEEFENVITEQNKKSVKKLDKLVNSINQHVAKELCDIKFLKSNMDEIELLVYGRNC